MFKVHSVCYKCRVTKWRPYHDFPVRLLSEGAFPQPLGFPLGAGTPVRVVDGGVLQEGREHEHETHHQVDVNSLDIRDTWKGGSHTVIYGCHGEYSCDTCNQEQ